MESQLHRTFRLLLLVILCLPSCSKEKVTEDAAVRMQHFIRNIASYACSLNGSFIIIPQNGVELAFNQAEPSEGINMEYLSAIDAFGAEELFYNGGYHPDTWRTDMLDQLVLHKPVLASEYVTAPEDEQHAVNECSAHGFRSFIRTAGNYDYSLIPKPEGTVNNNDIMSVGMVQNFLYLISTASFSSPGQMLDSIAATNYDLVIMDLFFDDYQLTPQDLQRIRFKQNGGKRLLISYISIGSAERYRYYWNPAWKLHEPDWIRKSYDGYPDEFWVEFWNDEWQQIVYGSDDSYIRKIIDAGFDGAYLDNVEAWYWLYHSE